jgi:hypothetical protein
MPKAIIKKVQFGVDALEQMWQYVEENTEYWMMRTQNYREQTLKEYARMYKGTPLNLVRNVPWPNAANNVIQVIATHCDQLLSRVMAIYMVDPLFTVKILGDIDGEGELSGEEQRIAFENFLSDMAMNPEELDFYRIEQAWFSSAIRNGTGVIKLPWQYVVEKQLIQMEGVDLAGTPMFEDYVRYDSPKPENVPQNKFVTNLNFNKLEDSNFKFEIVTVSRHQLEERKELGIFADEDIDKIIAQPDRQGRAELQQYIEETQGLKEGWGGLQGDEFDLIEVEFTYWHNGQKFSLRATHHPMSKTRLIAYYNYYPKNMSIYEDAKLAYDDDQYLGYGLAEMLQGYQDEISVAHNQRTDAGTLNNTTAFRINRNSKLHSILTFYPGVMVPADAGEIERLDTSNANANITDSESLTNAYAMARSGIDPATGGTGGGVVNAKRGVYSSGGTFAVLQQQNNRTSLRTSDMRAAHTRAGVKFANMYAYFGLGSKLRSFGRNAETLKNALRNIKSGKLGLLVRPSTASINKEMEKQNDIMLSQTLERLYAGDAQILQSLTTAGMPPDLAAYYKEVLKAKNSLMRHIVRNFGHADVARLIPEIALIKGEGNVPTSGPQAQQLGGGAGGPRGISAVNPQQGGGITSLPVGSGESANRVPVEREELSA